MEEGFILAGQLRKVLTGLRFCLLPVRVSVTKKAKGVHAGMEVRRGSVEDREPWQPAGENVHYSGYCRLAQGIFTETKGTLFRAHLGWAFTSKTSSQDTLEKLHIHFNDSPVHSS